MGFDPAQEFYHETGTKLEVVARLEIVGSSSYRFSDFSLPYFLKMKGIYAPLKIVGIFWLVMGVVVLLASIFPPTRIGKIVDLVAGGLLVSMGSLFIFLNRKFGP